MAEVLRDQAGVAGRVAEPGRGGVAQGVCRDPLLEPSSVGCPTDDPGQDRRLQAASSRC